MSDFIAVQNICSICKCSVATYYANEELFKDYMPEHLAWHEAQTTDLGIEVVG